jgi:hypothetical protein
VLPGLIRTGALDGFIHLLTSATDIIRVDSRCIRPDVRCDDLGSSVELTVIQLWPNHAADPLDGMHKGARWNGHS